MSFVSKQRAFHLSVADGTNKFAMGLRDLKLDSVSMAIGIRSVFEYEWHVSSALYTCMLTMISIQVIHMCRKLLHTGILLHKIIREGVLKDGKRVLLCCNVHSHDTLASVPSLQSNRVIRLAAVGPVPCHSTVTVLPSTVTPSLIRCSEQNKRSV